MSAGEAAVWPLVLQWFFVAYFIALNCGNLLLYLFSLRGLRRFIEAQALDTLPQTATRHEPPVSIIVPARNSQASIVATIRATLQLDYPEFEVIVVNDGSKDDTLPALKEAFSLGVFPEAYWKRLRVGGVRGIYRSVVTPNLRVIDKSRGGRGDALNAGINAARYPLFCVIDPGLFLRSDSLRRIVRPFLDNAATIACGSTARVANGSIVSGGFMGSARLPRRLAVLFQVVEQLRALVFPQLGWSALNASLTLSRGMHAFRKQAVFDAGGYRTDAVGADTELVMRLHRLHRTAREPYRIAFVPDALCWTAVPASFSALRRQRRRWQFALADSVAKNLRLLFHRRGGTAGWAAFPFLLTFELLGPLIELLGYALIAAAFASGMLSWQAFAAFMLVAVGFGTLLSVSALLLEEASVRFYRRPSQAAALLAVALFENLGYRQLVALWRVEGLLRWPYARKTGPGRTA